MRPPPLPFPASAPTTVPMIEKSADIAPDTNAPTCRMSGWFAAIQSPTRWTICGERRDDLVADEDRDLREHRQEEGAEILDDVAEA
jgi:hypothetical protein